METKELKKDPTQQTLENREKRLDVIRKISDIKKAEERFKLEKRKEELEIEKKELECERLRQPSQLFDLYVATQLTVIDEERTLMGSEPVMKNLFSNNEIEIIKKKIIEKLKKL